MTTAVDCSLAMLSGTNIAAKTLHPPHTSHILEYRS